MTPRIHPRLAFLASVLAFLGGWTTLPSRAQDGIFADFTTTKGNFSCRLDYTNAPKAVANFIALATGERPWLDLPTGRAKTNAFYNGLTFHSVAPGALIRGGSPSGEGDDGPGYSLARLFSPALRHDGPGVLSMMNSGPGSGGSQFLITVAAAPWLDPVHSVFGRVVSGQNVVNAISQADASANGKPLTNIVIQELSIRRVGASAMEFNIHAQGLPLVTNPPLTVCRAGNGLALRFGNRLYADNRLYVSEDLAGWSESRLGIETALGWTNELPRVASRKAEFYRLAQVQYPVSTRAPKLLHGKTLVLDLQGLGALTLQFNSTGGGSYVWSGISSGNITSYQWIQDRYCGYLSPVCFSGLAPIAIRLDFDSGGGGDLWILEWRV